MSQKSVTERPARSSAAPGSSERYAEHLVGSVVAGAYRVVRRIGSGGIGHVYEAEHVRLGSKVALKALRAELGDRPLTLARFQREAKILAAFESDHVVRVLDCGELPDGVPYFVMELLRGDDLRSRLRQVGRLSEGSALDVALQACRGLAAVHAAGVIHRDLKPANLFLSQHAEDGERCKILDFGVARTLAAGDVTREGTAPGTLRYMAPEQVLQSAKPDARTDIYALGAILYEMLVGTPPHEGETAEELMFAIANRTPSPPHVVRPELREEVSAVVMRCLARSPHDRFQNTEELGAALKVLRAERPERPRSSGALDATLSERTLEHDRPAERQRSSRRPKNVWLMGLVLGSTVGLGAWNTLRERPTQPLVSARNAGSAQSRQAPAPTQEPAVAPGNESAAAPAPAVVTSASTTASAPIAQSPPKPKTRSAPKRPAEFGHVVEQESPYGAGE